MNKLEELAMIKAYEYIKQPDTTAVAITGSVARENTWEGSAVDLLVFHNGAESHEDGFESGIYWEASLKPAAWLSIKIDETTWLTPADEDDGRAYLCEALWGCRIVYDPSGKLSFCKNAVDQKVADRAWLTKRAQLFLAYGRKQLEQIKADQPLEAIIKARRIALEYGIAALWMLNGELFNSPGRLPERLSFAPGLQQIYLEINQLQEGFNLAELQSKWQKVAPEVQKRLKRCLEAEVYPLFEKGFFKGGLHFLRQSLPRLVEPEAVREFLGVERDLVAQKERVLEQTGVLLERIQQANDIQ